MIHDQGLPMYLWAEACSTVVYIHNRSPHKKMKDMTPKEAYTDVKPKASHLRIFGCLVYIHVPKEKRTKLEPVGRRCIFVGYSKSLKAYWIDFPGQRQIEVCKDVTFEEEEAYRRSSGSHAEIDSEE